MKQHYLIEPVDSLFFGKPRAFSMGENSVGLTSQFPPAPHTVVGAIRAQWALQHGWSGGPKRGEDHKWSDEIRTRLGGDEPELKGVSFAGPELAQVHSPQTADFEIEKIYPVPAALLAKKDPKASPKKIAIDLSTVARLKPSKNTYKTDIGEISLPLLDLPTTDTVKGRKTIANQYLTESGLQTFLQGAVPNKTEHWFTSAILSNEPRTGNKIDQSTGSVEQSMLYSTEHQRLHPSLRLVMQINEAPQNTTPPHSMALGGEARAATVESKPLPNIQIVSDLDKTQGNYLIYLRTALLLPSKSDGTTNHMPKAGEAFLNLPGKVISACLYPSTRHGEWIRKGASTPQTRSVLSAGSVIFMNVDSKDYDSETTALNLLAENSQIGERTTWGYGCIALGTW